MVCAQVFRLPSHLQVSCVHPYKSLSRAAQTAMNRNSPFLQPHCIQFGSRDLGEPPTHKCKTYSCDQSYDKRCTAVREAGAASGRR